ncbi:dephospho-CoA kinase [Amphibacillus sp. MSJ-3]|uniref:dephospho-CoA kinase n=1 Tax=Amphibacillus sp. MSJ-3 TaxID=2841505 RepID=UPI001C0EB17F|nr:dephospho-CoA kinase [Amphibacillus sp. MSJ-3]MBU5593652.1 dephospho-CoA kinase [Amphibacillus sp. MSJ-3]
MALVIGLTGSIATGKSTIAKLFKKEGIPLVDADLISRQIVEPGREAYQKIITVFGQDILARDQSIDRKKLAELIFSDQEKRDQLNRILHPIIIEQIIQERDRLINQDEQLIILDIPLLFELQLDDLVDRTIVVYTSPIQQLQRLKNRDNLTEEQAKKRIASQISIDQKAKKANFVLDNSDEIDKTEAQFYLLLDQLKKLINKDDLTAK